MDERSNSWQEANNAAQAADNRKQNAAHKKHKKIDYLQTGVYVFLALVVCLAFYLNDRNSQKDLERLCQSGQDARQVQRSLVNEIYALNVGLIEPNRQYTKTEVKRIKVFVKDVAAFRKRSYNEIKPSEICAPYVTDDNVKPPASKLPKIQSKGLP